MEACHLHITYRKARGALLTRHPTRRLLPRVARRQLTLCGVSPFGHAHPLHIPHRESRSARSRDIQFYAWFRELPGGQLPLCRVSPFVEAFHLHVTYRKAQGARLTRHPTRRLLPRAVQGHAHPRQLPLCGVSPFVRANPLHIQHRESRSARSPDIWSTCVFPREMPSRLIEVVTVQLSAKLHSIVRQNA